MTEPTPDPAATVVQVVDADGNTHWSARDSSFVTNGIADGSLRYAADVAADTEPAATEPAATEPAATEPAATEPAGRPHAGKPARNKAAGADTGGQASSDASVS